ncbi:flavin monoamine oxidase family protein [Silvimonas amylolytica]|uniref:flavin monoamine oxidase family protein n=1 Tax=Silvimonas amylolytica TaxID=449663 RepID=UPI00166897D5|nr:FAD-dependent oxidoreductase [Silvimonas amylolytica]
MTEKPILILGAGLSGLYAALQLRHAGRQVLLVEARPRPGGRILSESPHGPGHSADMGPGWYWPEMNPRMAALVRQLGLADYPQYEAGARLREDADGTIQTLRHSWFAQPESRRLVGGMQALVAALVAQLGPAVLQLDTRASALSLTPDGVEVEVSQRDTLHMIRAAAVISTLPPRLLANAVRMTPPVSSGLRQRWQETPTWMAGQAKFVAAYDQPFWRTAGLSGDVSSQRGPMVEIHDASNEAGTVALLFGFIGVPAQIRQQLGEAGLQQRAINQLARLFGPEAQTPSWTALKDWAQDPYTATQQDQQPLHQHPYYGHTALPEAWAGHLMLAGTEFAPDMGGYLEGALAAADAAVATLLAGT